MKGGWRCALGAGGGPFVTTSGMTGTQLLSADSSATQLKVRCSVHQPTLSSLTCPSPPPLAGAVATTEGLFGLGQGPIFLDEAQCVGNETHLLDCRLSAVGVHDCTHTEDAGIRCIGKYS